MKMLRHSVAVFVVVSLIGWAHCARAAVDITGRWDVTMQSQFFGPQTGEWDLAQLGGQITVVQRWAGPIFGVFTLRGTIDPDSGVFSFDLGSDPTCGDSRIDGTVVADGTTMSGTESLPLRIRLGCVQAGGPFTGVRTGPLPTRCGDGMLDDAGEQCDDFNQTSGDCCSSSCQLEPAGAPCSDGNVCTDDACDGAGTCQHADNSAPCGAICLPGTCAAGQCAFGDPAPAGTSCDDGDACTTGDYCDGGFCNHTDLVTCATCEQCDRDAGCVARPQPSFSCDVMATATLTLSVAKPAAPVVSWRRTDNRTDTSPVFRPVGDPRVDTEYTLCVFDAVGLVAEAVAPPAGTCGARPCWRGTRTGFQYRDRARASDGLEQIDLRAKDPLHGTLKLKAKGSNLHLPASLAGIVAPVVAELRAHNASHDQCWQSSFPSDATQRSAKALKARN